MKYLILIAALLSSGVCDASNAKGKIEKLIIGRNGHEVFVHLKNASQTCGRDHSLGFNYAFSIRDHEAGREMLSAMLAAKFAKREITIQGNNQCVMSPELETIAYIYSH